MLQQSMIQMKHQQILQQQILEVRKSKRSYFYVTYLLYVEGVMHDIYKITGTVPVEQTDVTISTRTTAECLPAPPAGPAEEEGGGDRGEPQSHQGEGEQVPAGRSQAER